MLNQKTKDDYDYKIAQMQERIISFNELYNKQLNYFRCKFNLTSQKHKVSVTTYKNSFDFTFIDLQEAKSYYEDLLKRWKSDIYIKLYDNRSIGTSCITAIEFIEGYHPEEYIQEEIDKWAKEQVEQEMKNWRVVDCQLEKFTMIGYHDEKFIYELEKQKDDLYHYYTQL